MEQERPNESRLDALLDALRDFLRDSILAGGLLGLLITAWRYILNDAEFVDYLALFLLVPSAIVVFLWYVFITLRAFERIKKPFKDSPFLPAARYLTGTLFITVISLLIILSGR